MATKYWTNRFEKLKLDEMNRVDTTISDLEDVYAYSLQRLQADIDHWYHRYASDNNLALADARKQLDARELKDFKLTLKQYERLAQQKELSKEHVKMLQNASTRVRLDRAQQLYIQVLQHTALLANNEQEILTKALSDAYESSTYKIAYETQLMTSKYKDVPLLNKTAVEQAISKPWTNDGKEFSSRIWDNRQNLVDTLQSEITRSLIIGEGSGKLADRIAKRYNVSFNNARRLAETEMAHVQELASKEQYENNGIEQYEILATLDNRTSSTCRHLDGKIVDMKDYKAGVTAPPFHCYCRTTTIPYIKGITDSKEDSRAYRDEDGKTAYTDETLSYDEWYNKYVRNKDTDSLVGLKTSNGITISSVSIHQQDRADERKVDIEGLKDAILKPLHISEIKVDEKGPSQRFIGNTITVNINPETGVIITSWRTGKRTIRKYKKKE